MNHKHQKYLDKKSVHKQWSYQKNPIKKNFDFIITIPCYDEYNYLFKTLESIDEQDQNLLKKTLVSIVINNSESEDPIVIQNNLKTFKKLLKYESSYELIAIDAFSTNNAINKKNAGVGMARKISVSGKLIKQNELR